MGYCTHAQKTLVLAEKDKLVSGSKSRLSCTELSLQIVITAYALKKRL